jgi:alkanesulfonate monooxygenase SsuD/methylene tetrahydromethanopterin reductase-like flavin-dependent oxidoreductase (luciferase family)
MSQSRAHSEGLGLFSEFTAKETIEMASEKPMKFGLMNLFPYADERGPDQLFQEALEEIVFAEKMGFDSVWLAEHHFSRYSIMPNPLMMAAAIAQRTKRIRIGTAVVIAPLYDPLRLAEDIALVDCLSDGRIDIGYGRGYQPLEFNGFGVDQGEATGRMNEIIDILKLAWTQETFSYSGEYYNYKDISIYPRPKQRPHPPIWRAAVSPDSFRFAAEHGQAVLTSPNLTPAPILRELFAGYRQTLRDHGYNDQNFDFPFMQQTYVGVSDEDAYNTPKKGAEWFVKTLSKLLPGGENVPSGYESYTAFKQAATEFDYDAAFAKGVNFGTADKIRHRIETMRDEVGMNHYLGWFSVGGMPHDTVMQSIERFAKEVIPHFR